MLISAGLRAPPHGVSSSVSGQGLRVPPPATSVVAVGAAGGVRRRRLAVVGVVAASAASPDELHARGRPFHGSSEELRELKRKISSLQMQQFAGEEKNELLDYLRSLLPEKVVELSEPSCPGVHDTIQSVVHGLLVTLPPQNAHNGPSAIREHGRWNPKFLERRMILC